MTSRAVSLAIPAAQVAVSFAQGSSEELGWGGVGLQALRCCQVGSVPTARCVTRGAILPVFRAQRWQERLRGRGEWRRGFRSGP